MFKKTTKNFDEEFIEFLIKKAKKGDVDAPWSLIKQIIIEIETCGFRINTLQKFTIQVLKEILQGVPPEEALLIRRKNTTGRKTKRYEDRNRDDEVAYNVFGRREITHITGEEHLTLEKCYKLVAKDFGISEDLVKSIYKEKKPGLMKEFAPFLKGK